MLKRNSCKLACVILALATAGSLAVSRTATQQDLPDGKGVEIARNKCLNCHEADLIVQQRLTRAGWVREIEKMVRWGAQVKDAEKELLADYFAARFAPRQATATTSDTERGKQVFESKCLNCHEDDLVKQQRLARAGWAREVEKMMRWGATLKDDEQAALVDYLFKHFPPQPPR